MNSSSKIKAVALALVLSGCNALGPRDPGLRDAIATANSGKVTHRQAADVEIALGHSLEETGDRETAEKAYREALKKNPKRADAEARLAILCDRKGHTQEANDHFARAASLDPKNPEILCDQGYSFYLQRRWADAESRLRKAIKADPNHARSHNNLGLVLARVGDETAALAEFQLAGCDPADARSNLALTLALEGHFDAARASYEKALALKPTSAVAKEGLRAANLALNAQADPKRPALAGAPRTDPAIRRASATVGTD